MQLDAVALGVHGPAELAVLELLDLVVDLDALAGSNGLSLTSTFVVRFLQYDNYDTGYDGFAFDDIDVTGGPAGTGPLAFGGNAIVKALRAGGAYEFRGIKDTSEGRALVFRLRHGGDGGVNFHELLVEQRIAGDQHLVAARLHHVLRDQPAENAFAQRLDHVAAFDDGLHGDEHPLSEGCHYADAEEESQGAPEEAEDPDVIVLRRLPLDTLSVVLTRSDVQFDPNISSDGNGSSTQMACTFSSGSRSIRADSVSNT